MHFDLGEDQLSSQQSLRGLLEKECPPERVRKLWATETGRSRELWAKLVGVGLIGALAPEEAGGLALDEIDLILLLEETGRAAVPEPVVETAAVAVPLLRDAAKAMGASADAKKTAEDWLARLASGEAIATVGHPIQPTIADAHVADLLLLERDGSIHALPRDRAKLAPQPASDLSRRLFTATWSPSEAVLLARGGDATRLLDAALDRGALASASQLVGIAQRLVDEAVGYAKKREQFGQAIGSFQAIKHHLASVQVKIEFARPLVYRAAHSVARDVPTRAVDVSQAKASAGEAAAFAARTALQVHGAIGYTWEVDLHLWMKRAWALDAAWGSRLWHRRRIAAAVLDGDGPPPSFGFTARAKGTALLGRVSGQVRV
jgi:alkylation response protein AidB-like acyl-CoA dehydrogenase